MKVNLNGRWDFYPDGGPSAHSIVVPTWWDSLPCTTGYPEEWSQSLYHGIYRRSFDLSEADLADDLFVHVGALASLGQVRVNGQSVGPQTTKGYLMTLLPYDLDINSTARAGSNQLEIEVWSVKELPEDALAPEDGPDRLLFPFGTENIVGRVGIGGDVWVESRPKLRIDDIQIIPDLKRNADPSDDELTAAITLVNHTPEARALTLTAQVRPWEGKSEEGSGSDLDFNSGLGSSLGSDSGFGAGLGASSSSGSSLGSDSGSDQVPSLSSSPSSSSSAAALSFETAQVELPAGASTVVRLTASWPDARYWSRSDPFLYQLEAELDSSSSKSSGTELASSPDSSPGSGQGAGPVSRSSERFGFRQFWREGDRYLLNGLPIRLRGDSLCLLNQGNRDLINEIGDAYGLILDDNHASDAMAAAWVDAYQHANANILRNHIRSIPSHALHSRADETGMLIEEESAFWNPGSLSNVSLNPPYYMNYSDEAIGYYCEWVRRWVRAYRNHPSIVLWSTTNEAWNPNDATELIPPLEAAALGEDPSRLVINDGFNKPITNEDSRHYFGGYPSGMTSSPDIYSLYHIDSDLPLGAGEEFSVSTAGIPLYNDEGGIRDIYHGRLNGNPDTISRADFGREVGRVTRGVRTTRMADWKPFCLSMFIYDNIERFVELDQAATGHGLNPRMLMRPQFDPTKAGSDRWVEGGAFEYFANSYADVAAYDKDFDQEPRLGQPHRVYEPGSTSLRAIIVYNDEETRGTQLGLKWELGYQLVSDGSTHPTFSGRQELSVSYAGHVEVPVSIRVPEDPQAVGAKLILALAVSKEGQEVFRENNFLGWIGQTAGPKLRVRVPERDLGNIGWHSRTVKHSIHLLQDGGAMSERWTARVECDASGAFQLEQTSGNLRHEQDIFYTLNTAALEPGRSYAAAVTITGEAGEQATFTVRFTAGEQPEGEDKLNLAAGARVSVSSLSGQPGWTAGALVDGLYGADYNRFGWSSALNQVSRREWVQLEFLRPQTVTQVALVPRAQNPGGTVSEAFHGKGAGVGGVLEFAAGHKASDPNQGQGFPLDFTISLSADGAKWVQVARCHDYPLPSNGKPQAFDCEPVQGVRFLRVEADRLRSNPHEGNAYALQLTQIAAYADHHLPTLPAAPRSLTASKEGHQLRVSWPNGSDGRSPLTGTRLELADARGRTMSALVSGSQREALLPAVPYSSWRIRAKSSNAIGDSEYSQAFEIRLGSQEAGELTAELLQPPQPTARVDVDTSTVTVFWSAGDGLDPALEGWNVLLARESDDKETYVAWTPAAVEAVSAMSTAESPGQEQGRKQRSWRCSFPQLSAGTYRAWLEASDGFGRVSKPSAPTERLIVAQVPAQPHKPGVTSSGQVMRATWQAPADGGTPITAYVLTVRNLTEGKSQVLRVGAGQTAASLDGLEAGNYTLSVIAVNAIGPSEESSPSLPCIIA
ncbi:hypothetical protein KIM372_02590 [Bombiscardovia nodaiensis]|uniref:Fibronectin type-III domain-containing protein n=1 Tax=Bombiscardovia nodaiensis TaxID=2932181 RepID=A0ABN6SB86_9BIFI|nr:hypothetical protein KIM372_02590 [Bombiscardovia nodaiensis]